MMMPNQAGYQSYQRNKYETASPHKLILMLYTGAIQSASRAQSFITEGQHVEANKYILKVQDILYELISTLNEQEGGEIAGNLKALYFYMLDKLVQANLKKEVEPLNEVIGILRDIKDAWEQIGKGVTLGQATT